MLHLNLYKGQIRTLVIRMPQKVHREVKYKMSTLLFCFWFSKIKHSYGKHLQVDTVNLLFCFFFMLNVTFFSGRQRIWRAKTTSSALVQHEELNLYRCIEQSIKMLLITNSPSLTSCFSWEADHQPK